MLKFANLNPHVFATSSFDKEVKMWDLRDPGVSRLLILLSFDFLNFFDPLIFRWFPTGDSLFSHVAAILVMLWSAFRRMIGDTTFRMSIVAGDM